MSNESILGIGDILTQLNSQPSGKESDGYMVNLSNAVNYLSLLGKEKSTDIERRLYVYCSKILSRLDENEVGIFYNEVNSVLNSHLLTHLMSYDTASEIINNRKNRESRNVKIEAFHETLNNIFLLMRSDVSHPEYEKDIDEWIKEVLSANPNRSAIDALVGLITKGHYWYFMLLLFSIYFSKNFRFCIDAMILSVDFVEKK